MDKQFNCRSYNTFSDKVKVSFKFVTVNQCNLIGQRLSDAGC